ncbi:MAG: hypothetical protein AAGA96_04510 [Verrucomicrobiota bacterium]
MIRILSKRPWILVIVAFSVLITSWVALLRLANQYRPETVPLETIERSSESR